MKTQPPPSVGWGILDPDPELSQETIDLVARLHSLPDGQRDALLTRCVPRYLAVEAGLEPGEEPSTAGMVDCSSDLSNFWLDILGHR